MHDTPAYHYRHLPSGKECTFHFHPSHHPAFTHVETIPSDALRVIMNELIAQMNLQYPRRWRFWLPDVAQ